MVTGSEMRAAGAVEGAGRLRFRLRVRVRFRFRFRFRWRLRFLSSCFAVPVVKPMFVKAFPEGDIVIQYFTSSIVWEEHAYGIELFELSVRSFSV